MNDERPGRTRPGQQRPREQGLAKKLRENSYGLLDGADKVPENAQREPRDGNAPIGANNFLAGHLGHCQGSLIGRGHGRDQATVRVRTRQTDARMCQALAMQDGLTTVVAPGPHGPVSRAISSTIHFNAPDPEGVMACLVYPAVLMVSMNELKAAIIGPIREGLVRLTRKCSATSLAPGLRRRFAMLIAIPRARYRADIEPFRSWRATICRIVKQQPGARSRAPPVWFASARFL